MATSTISSRRPAAAAGRSARRQWRRARRRAVGQAAGVVTVATLGTWGVGGVLAGPAVGDPAGAGALLLGAWAGRWWVGRVDAARWARGAAGEEATAELLAAALGRRWTVLHDLAVPVEGSRANIDHVVIGRSGCWVIDSKAYRAPLRAGWRSVRAGEHDLDTGPVRWEADALGAALGCEARPIVAVHGDGLPRRGRKVGGVRVVPAGALAGQLRRRRGSARLSRRQQRAMAAACAGLARR